MISKIKATYYNQIKDMVNSTPNDTSLGRKVRKYVCGTNLPKKQSNSKKKHYIIRLTY